MADQDPCPALTEGKIDILQPVSVEAPEILESLNEALTQLRAIAAGVQRLIAGGISTPTTGTTPTTGITGGLPVFPSLPTIGATAQAGPQIEALLETIGHIKQHSAITVQGYAELIFKAKTRSYVHTIDIASGINVHTLFFNFGVATSVPTPYTDTSGSVLLLKGPDGAADWIPWSITYNVAYRWTRFSINRTLEPGEGIYIILGAITANAGYIFTLVNYVPSWDLYEDSILPQTPPPSQTLTPGEWVTQTPSQEAIEMAALSTDYLIRTLTPSVKMATDNAVTYADQLTRTVGLMVSPATLQTVRDQATARAIQILDIVVKQARASSAARPAQSNLTYITPTMPQPTTEAPRVLADLSSKLSSEIPSILLRVEPLATAATATPPAISVADYSAPLASMLTSQLARPVYAAYGLTT